MNNVTRLYIVLFLTIFSTGCLAQQYKKDPRTLLEKEDPYNQYQTDLVSKVDLFKALEIAGIRMFKIPLLPFDKEYKLEVLLSEYVDGVKISSTNLYFYGKNSYTHYGSEGEYYTDYIDNISFFTREKNDTTVGLSIQTQAFSISDIALVKRISRNGQTYNWRRYSKTPWELDQEIPLLVFASSWYDEQYKFDRFCGVVDMSRDQESAKELLDSSGHYYIISYRVKE